MRRDIDMVKKLRDQLFEEPSGLQMENAAPVAAWA
jgi:hypothetical protein